MNGRIEADPRRYMRVAAWLQCQINDGTLRPGDAAPSINDIAARHGYCRDTCTKGLNLLEQDGTLFRVPGRGYYVSGQRGPASG
jgi:DNA-binding GntR family transcriptional regulator